MEEIIGRVQEIRVLERLCSSEVAEYGRRRIGKTFLISHFFKNKGVYFEVIGGKDSSKKREAYEFP